ncbi:MAG: metallophosphoesterase family protein [Candidatus Methanospirareceae archaeon]
MQRIVVLSDTHLRREDEDLPEVVRRSLEKADLIIHCGDFEELFALERLRTYGKVIAVCGNMDSMEIKNKLPRKEVIEVEGFKIGITHGYGAPTGIEDRVKREFGDEKLDVILYGHSHVAKKEFREGILFFNPGSPTDKKFAPFNSYGELLLGGGEIKAEIIRI